MLQKIKEIFKLIFKEDNVFFIGSSDKLPEPLTKEDEVMYVQRAMDGDKMARAKLIEHNLRLVVFLSKKYENTGIDLEDLVSIGSVGLIKGVNTYKLDKNIKLATYASRCIDNEILMFLRKNKKRRGEISFEDNLSYDSEGNELHLEDILGTEIDYVPNEYEKILNKQILDIVTKGLEKEIEKKMLYNEIENLNERDKKIMVLRYGLFGTDEMTQKDVANLLGISQSYISRIEKKVIRKLKNLDKD